MKGRKITDMNKQDITCVTPEFPFCPLCPYALLEPENVEGADEKLYKVFCLLSNCYV